MPPKKPTRTKLPTYDYDERPIPEPLIDRTTEQETPKLPKRWILFGLGFCSILLFVLGLGTSGFFGGMYMIIALILTVIFVLYGFFEELFFSFFSE